MKFSIHRNPVISESTVISLLLIFCSLSLTGCPEEITAIDAGILNGGDIEISDTDLAMDDDGCQNDNDCDQDDYCQLDDNSTEGLCTLGCRLTPNDSCIQPNSRKVCDPITRECILSCDIDNQCFNDQYCADGVCVTGCRLEMNDTESSCPDTESGPQLCDEDSRTCQQGGICCDLDDQCSISEDRACEQIGGEILLGVTSCEPNPCRALCSRDSQCPEGEFCSDFGRCAPGCRLDDPTGCPEDLTCHPTRHDCVNFICETNQECPDWQYCAFEGRCRNGCRDDGCQDGLICADDHVCRPICNEDRDCDDDQYCDDSQFQCRLTCDPLTHQGCSTFEACIDGRCILGCADDIYELEGDQDLATAPSIEWTLGEATGVRSSGTQYRTLCPEDEDWIKIEIAQDERIEIRLESRPSSGPLHVSLLNSSGDILRENNLWSIVDQIRYPSRGQGLASGDYYLRVKGTSQIEVHPYQLEVRVAPQELACFSDRNDPIDDTPNGGQLFGLTPALRFTEQASGDLCFGDRDFYCFPMSMSDGLSIYLSTPLSCDPISVQVAPSSIFEQPPSSFEGYTAEEVLAANGQNRYELLLDPETRAFTNDEWCINVSTEGSCESYSMSASFSRRQLVCSDLREPNNTPNQATILDQNGPLADGNGDIVLNQDVQLSENLFLCQGDRDVFSVQSTAGDAWRAWLVDDSDPEDDPLRGRGQLVGELKIRFLNSEGLVVGDSASINPRSDDPMATLQYATAVSAANQSLFIEVYGIEDSAGPYQLYLRRIPSDGACSQDVNEPDSRDDQLNPVSQLQPQREGRLVVNNGYLCDPDNGFDEDWFTFEVEQANTRLCINSTFRHRDGNINVELFEAMDVTIGEFCTIHEDCRLEQVNSSCIGRRCRAPLARANSQDDGEMLHFNSLETRAGRYYARVYSPTPTENTYQLSVSMVPPSIECPNDVHEGETDNNRAQDATRLGSGRIEICDAWLCENERSQGDWYEIVVPASAQRTIHVAFESQQGRLTLSAVDASSINGDTVDSPRSQSRNVHCINVAAGIRPATIKLQIAGDTFNINQNRLDYLLRVVPTNLFTNSRGACDLLNNGLFNEAIWPTLDLRD